MKNQLTQTSPSYYSINNLDIYSYIDNISEKTKINQPLKLISQPYIAKTPHNKQSEFNDIAEFSELFNNQLELNNQRKQIFNSIETIQLNKLENQDNAYKKSSPPPGFEMQFPAHPDTLSSNQDLIKQQQQSFKVEQQKLEQYQQKHLEEQQQQSIQCKVLYIRGLDHPSLNLQALYNIFSNFGTIIRMLFFRQKGAMLVQYFNAQQASQCKEWMNNVTMFGNAIRIFDSNHQEIKQKQSIWNAGDYWERDYLCKERGKQTNPPSEVIHIANLRPEVCQQEIILQIFSMIGCVQNLKFQIKFVQVLDIRFLLDDPQKKMCLLRYSTIEESINAVALLHGYQLYGRQIQVSFTRSKV